MLKLKVGDTVKILSGKDKTREGKIEKIFLRKKLALLTGLNIFKKHIKGRPGQKGGIYDMPRPLSLSKIALVCPKCKKTGKVGFKQIGQEKVRFCKKCGKEVDTK